MNNEHVPVELPPQKSNKKLILVITSTLLALLVIIAIVLMVLSAHKSKPNEPTNKSTESTNKQAIQAGKRLSNNKCEGEGPVTLTHPPMNADDFAFIIPYGLMVDSHVTPIDHQYFSPAVFHSPPDTYPVYAMADGTITEISHRAKGVGYDRPSNDYRFVFSHTCTLLTYYDLVTSLAPDMKAEFNKKAKVQGTNSFANLNIEVKAGQLVGYIGGQTLDFAVWDTTKPLSGFVSSKLYEGEPWKIYTADPLDYYSEELKKLAISKYLRSTPPASGKIDYDIDGRLVGNWFQENTNGYAGDRDQPDGKYWRGHLALAPDHIDPAQFIASFGTFRDPGDGEQFMIDPGSANPAEVSTESGLIKYQLFTYSYSKTDGTDWNRMTHALDPKMIKNTHEPTAGCLLLQLIDARKLKAEPFPNANCAKINEFSDKAIHYIR